MESQPKEKYDLAFLPAAACPCQDSTLTVEPECPPLAAKRFPESHGARIEKTVSQVPEESGHRGPLGEAATLGLVISLPPSESLCHSVKTVRGDH